MASRTLPSGRKENRTITAARVLSQETNEVDRAIAALRRFVRHLKNFPQVEVKAHFGDPGSVHSIEYAKQNGLHPDIVAFHAIMNGCYLRWRFRGDGVMFREGDGGGIEIPTIGQFVADQSRYGIECNSLDRVQVVDRAALADGSGRFPFYMNDNDHLHAFDGKYVDYCPGSLALLVSEGISHLFSPGWLRSYGEFVAADELERSQDAEAENRRQLQAFGLGLPK